MSEIPHVHSLADFRKDPRLDDLKKIISVADQIDAAYSQYTGKHPSQVKEHSPFLPGAYSQVLKNNLQIVIDVIDGKRLLSEKGLYVDREAVDTIRSFISASREKLTAVIGESVYARAIRLIQEILESNEFQG